ncbi:MAG: endonuclease III [Candidatus Harrisonbacteria bacterium CG10_big_fil_rev_8_21_14_0_10_40_38]|uniref:Endonuclease III n=1 Tax=Candidatus Harrisonbacteria bacterium CG10_big_fil_rev_8_21_14_0_10_40_38 TaxID=1974583 RepID=A0A2H0URY2_9BACT|nr:MAG: endonuclease III [Candidatus Harrisonbacteria bacterium CG10_big_fil_rev_8_21_14_0_10_40_38]
MDSDNAKRAEKIIKILKKLFPKTKIALDYSNNWELVVAVILSAQTTDKKVNEVTKRLFKKYPKLDSYAKADISEFQKDIKEIGLYRAKAKNILSTAKIIKDQYNGVIPKTIKELVALPGIGRKTANVILGNAYGIVDGIAVDTHVVRLSRLFGLTKHKDAVKIEKDLMEILPKKEWFNFTYRMIDYGRKYCTARCKHDVCPLREYIKNKHDET